MKYFDSFNNFKEYCCNKVKIEQRNVNSNGAEHPYIVNITDMNDSKFQLQVSII